jgi:hypothetical protein
LITRLAACFHYFESVLTRVQCASIRQRKLPLDRLLSGNNALIQTFQNVPHLGNVIGSVLSADCFARYAKGRGYQVRNFCLVSQPSANTLSVYLSAALMNTACGHGPNATYSTDMNQVPPRRPKPWKKASRLPSEHLHHAQVLYPTLLAKAQDLTSAPAAEIDLMLWHGGFSYDLASPLRFGTQTYLRSSATMSSTILTFVCRLCAKYNKYV